MKHRVARNARCPFYKHEDTQVIYCDGVSGQTVIHLAFANSTDALAYKRAFCRSEYQLCRIAQMLEEIEDEGAWDE